MRETMTVERVSIPKKTDRESSVILSKDFKKEAPRVTHSFLARRNSEQAK